MMSNSKRDDCPSSFVWRPCSTSPARASFLRPSAPKRRRGRPDAHRVFRFPALWSLLASARRPTIRPPLQTRRALLQARLHLSPPSCSSSAALSSSRGSERRPSPFTTPAVPSSTGRGVRPDSDRPRPRSPRGGGIQRYRPPSSSSPNGGLVVPSARTSVTGRPEGGQRLGSTSSGTLSPSVDASLLGGPKQRAGPSPDHAQNRQPVDPTRTGRARTLPDPERAGGTSEGSAKFREGHPFTTPRSLFFPPLFPSLPPSFARGWGVGRGAEEERRLGENTASAGPHTDPAQAREDSGAHTRAASSRTASRGGRRGEHSRWGVLWAGLEWARWGDEGGCWAVGQASQDVGRGLHGRARARSAFGGVNGRGAHGEGWSVERVTE